MVLTLRSVAGLAVLSGVANAKLYVVPEATATFNLPLDQVNPYPTKAPAYAELRRRQTSSPTIVLEAPDNTCGFISGRAGAAYYCGTAATCFFFTASRNNPGRVACCDSDDCGLRRACYDASQVSASSCDGGCLVDKYTLKCTNTARPYCNTVSFPGNIVDYWCNSDEISTTQAGQTTYAGGPQRVYAEITLPDDSTTSSMTRTAISSQPDTPPEIGPATTTPTPTPTSTPEPSTSTPIGAIVGGVIGGLAVIALVAFGIWFLLRKKKNQQPQGQQVPVIQQHGHPPPGQPQMAFQQPPPPQGPPSPYAPTTQTQTLYDPKFGGQGGYPPSYGGTPPPQGGQPPQQQQQQAYFAGNMVPDRTDTASPSAVSQMTNNRFSAMPVSPDTTGGFQQSPQQQFAQQQFPQQQQQQVQQQPPPTIHEAPDKSDGHRGQMHELA